MIPTPMERTLGTERLAYASAVAGLWERLGATLARLERIAESPGDESPKDVLDELPSLQYSLHAGAELALGIDPPADAAPVHAELIAALAHARDATAEMAVALESGGDDLVERLLPEWRGALFRVRLARLRALERFPLELADERRPRRKKEPEPGEASPVAAVAAAVLVIAGALLFTAGAVLAEWPVWTAGLALFGGGFLLLRP